MREENLNAGESEDAADDVAALLRIAGRHPAVPEDRTARVREAVHTRWRHMAQARRRRRLAWLTAVTAAAAMAVIILSLRSGGQGEPGGPAAGMIIVESVQGAAWKEQGSGSLRVPLGEGSLLEPDTTLTTSAEGRLAFRYAGRHSIRLDTGTRVRLVDALTLAIDRGTLYVDSQGTGAPRGSGTLSVLTPFGTVHEQGTQYEVSLEEATLRLRVREGLVQLHRDGDVHTVERAKELTLASDGSLSRAEIPTHGPPWDWTQQVAAVPDFSGRSARAFLDWVARERGLELRFADDGLARSADRIVLGGSVGRLRLSEALDAVLPTCAMAYRVDGGTLLILPT